MHAFHSIETADVAYRQSLACVVAWDSWVKPVKLNSERYDPNNIFRYPYLKEDRFFRRAICVNRIRCA